MTDSLQPNETLQAQVSAFVDDELPTAETDLFVRRLVKDAELKQCMARYQLMGEALRAPGTRVSRDFSARIAAALETQIPAEMSAPAASGRSLRWLKPAGGAAIAASVALIAVMAVRTQTPAVDSLQASSAPGESLQPVMLTAQHVTQADSYVVPAPSNAPSAPIPATRLTNYVVAHSEFASPLGRRNVVTGLLAGEHVDSEPVTDAEQSDR